MSSGVNVEEEEEEAHFATLSAAAAAVSASFTITALMVVVESSKQPFSPLSMAASSSLLRVRFVWDGIHQIV
jgi:hypothetical protein